MNMKTYFLLATFLLRFFFSHYSSSMFHATIFHFFSIPCSAVLTDLLRLASKRCISSWPFRSLYLSSSASRSLWYHRNEQKGDAVFTLKAYHFMSSHVQDNTWFYRAQIQQHTCIEKRQVRGWLESRPKPLATSSLSHYVTSLTPFEWQLTSWSELLYI